MRAAAHASKRSSRSLFSCELRQGEHSPACRIYPESFFPHTTPYLILGIPPAAFRSQALQHAVIQATQLGFYMWDFRFSKTFASARHLLQLPYAFIEAGHKEGARVAMRHNHEIFFWKLNPPSGSPTFKPNRINTFAPMKFALLNPSGDRRAAINMVEFSDP
jgi:hypothetical protein